MNLLSLSHLPRLLELIVKEEVDGTLSINQSLLQADEVLLLLQGLLLALLTLPGQLEPLELGLAAAVVVVVVVVVVDAHPLLCLLHLLQSILKHLK